MATARYDSVRPGGGAAGEGWDIRLESLLATYTARRLDEVTAVLARADAAAREGRWAAVAVSYDAAAAFEPAMPAGRTTEFPLVWVGVYEQGAPPARTPRGAADTHAPGLHLLPAISRDVFAAGVRAVQEHIRAGDTYQVNLTFPMRSGVGEWGPGVGGRGSGIGDRGSGIGTRLYEHLRLAQQAPYCAQLDLGDHLVLSFSPELFFERRGSLLLARPMKGTRPRGRWLEEDEALARSLSASDKERAENVMIVDLLRNDIGRVALSGSVRVPELFRVERYPTLWQMTSAIEGRVAADTTLVDLFRALFPCGSVTGAPKIRTMQIIAELEPEARGLYTGAIGFVRPGGDCIFNVAIRTIVVDRRTGIATMGVGAGITADSVPEEEYEECLLKAAFAAAGEAEIRLTPGATHQREYALLETMRLEKGGIVRLERHLARMAASARYFGFEWDEQRVRAAVHEATRAHANGCWRMRLVVGHDGAPEVACTAHDEQGARPWRVAFADRPVDSRDPFLFNKTTQRAVYDRARRSRPDVDDVLLWNERGEATESTIANLVVEIAGERVTPPITCGLLGGVLRAELLEAGMLRERVLTRGEVARASRIWLLNSLRGWIEAELVR